MLLNSLILLLAGASAHPGESHEVSDEAHFARRSFIDHVKRESGSCNALSRRSNEQIAEKHLNKIAELRREVQANKQKRDTSSDDADRYASIDHESNRTDISTDMSLSDLFTSDDATCLLQPEVTNGPYYVTGEYIRDDITEDQDGVPLYIAVEFFDTNTCETIPNLYWEVWHCNPLGAYSGVQASTNDNGADLYNSTFLRGIMETDENGAALMKTIFPGHYDGRATHVHMIAHQNVTVYDNGTIGSGAADSGNVLHIGQMFFDQDLISEVSAVSPYSDNDQEITENTEDSILVSEEGADAPDPFPKYVKLGDDISDGLYAWIAIGIDSTASYTASPAAYYDAEGGHSTGNTMGPGSGGDMGGMSGNGTGGMSGNGTGGMGNNTDGMSGNNTDGMPSGGPPGNSTVDDSQSGSVETSGSTSESTSSTSGSLSADSVSESTATSEDVTSSGAGTIQVPSMLTLFAITAGSLVAFYF